MCTSLPLSSYYPVIDTMQTIKTSLNYDSDCSKSTESVSYTSSDSNLDLNEDPVIFFEIKRIFPMTPTLYTYLKTIMIRKRILIMQTINTRLYNDMHKNVNISQTTLQLTILTPQYYHMLKWTI